MSNVTPAPEAQRKGSWPAGTILGSLLAMAILVFLIRPRGGYTRSFAETTLEVFLSGWWEYVSAAIVSSAIILVGSLIGFWIGFVFSVLAFRLRRARSVITPVVTFLAPIPIIVWIPFAIGLAGIGLVHVLIIVVIGAVFTSYLYCLDALGSIPRSALDVFNANTTHRVTRLFSLYLPKCVEGVSSIYRIYLAFAWVAVIISEVGMDERSGSWTGLGYKFFYAYNMLQTHGVVISLALLVAAAYVLDRLFYYAFLYLNRWKRERD